MALKMTPDDLALIEEKIIEAAHLISFRNSASIDLSQFYYAFAGILFGKVYESAPSIDSANFLLNDILKKVQEKFFSLEKAKKK